MVMTADLTVVHKRLLDALKASGEWLDRDAIAESLGKELLNSSERQRLEELAEMGLAEKSTETRGITEAYVYRVKSES